MRLTHRSIHFISFITLHGLLSYGSLQIIFLLDGLLGGKCCKFPIMMLHRGTDKSC